MQLQHHHRPSTSRLLSLVLQSVKRMPPTLRPFLSSNLFRGTLGLYPPLALIVLQLLFTHLSLSLRSSVMSIVSSTELITRSKS
ncbi:hypothetical protein CI102_1640 [Trichoderma harzianum]|nr:hypothetical protein CI102_1640 [Trichoderma harzianum]